MVGARPSSSAVAKSEMTPEYGDEGSCREVAKPIAPAPAGRRSQCDPWLEAIVASLERALRHYGIDGLERTAALETAAYRLFLARQRAATAPQQLVFPPTERTLTHRYGMPSG